MRLPAWMTFPMMTDPRRSASSPERLSVSRTTTVPSSVAGTPLSDPLKAPMGVRIGLQRTTSRVLISILQVGPAELAELRSNVHPRHRGGLRPADLQYASDVSLRPRSGNPPVRRVTARQARPLRLLAAQTAGG